MATPNEKLAASLARLRQLQNDGKRVFQSKALGRVHRERLIKNGFLQEVIRGWLISTGPDVEDGDTTPWYSSFWEFCSRYCDARFGPNWNLSPEQSLMLHAENNAIPTQVIVYAEKGTSNTRGLLFGTSIYDLKQKKKQRPPPTDLTVKDGLRLYTPEASLLKVPEHFFQRMPIEAQVVLASIRDTSGVLARLLDGGHSTVASRLAGAFRRSGRADVANDILKTMKGVGYNVREVDPFSPQQKLSILSAGTTPVVGRIKALWDTARSRAAQVAPKVPGLPADKGQYLSFVDEIYKRDAYHSLSIEGYTVSDDLIERVRVGNWDPDKNRNDRESLNALAARGYWEAFQLVRGSVAKLLDGAPPGPLIRDAHREWLRALFQPAVAIGHMRAAALAGYRNQPIYIRGSRHVPPRWESVFDAMTTLMDLLDREAHPFVRAVLGHWLLGYIHPYFDGNGRIARFLTNAMLASGGYPWTVIRVEDRAAYMGALESASVGGDVGPFATFIADRIFGTMAQTVQAAAEPVRLEAPRKRARAQAPKPRGRSKKRAATSAG